MSKIPKDLIPDLVEWLMSCEHYHNNQQSDIFSVPSALTYAYQDGVGRPVRRRVAGVERRFTFGGRVETDLAGSPLRLDLSELSGAEQRSALGDDRETAEMLFQRIDSTVALEVDDVLHSLTAAIPFRQACRNDVA